MNKYDVFWVDLEPAKGAMMRKTRPAVIMSPTSQNKHLKTVVICPVTSRIHEHWPTRVQIKIGQKKGEVAIDQIRTIPREGLKDKIKSLSQRERRELKEAVLNYFKQD